VAFEREATLLAAAKLGSGVKVTGFLAARSRTSKTVVLHATQVEFEQGE
jgi:primosomal replication protein N